MKSLILLRHGKSNWSTDYGTDHDRPLAPRGHEAAKRVGEFLSTAGLAPDLLITSSAERAHSTATLAAEAGDFSAELRVEPQLYGNSTRAVLELLQQQDDRYESVMMVGHEPTWSGLASVLIGGGHLRVVTAAAVVIDLAVGHWSEARAGCGELRMLLPPRWLTKALDRA